MVLTALPVLAASPATPVDAIERETGLSKEVIRKWETRYGFPRPLRDENGDRLYPNDQVFQLRLIRSLISSGMRPHQVVGRPQAELASMVQEAQPADICIDSPDVLTVFDALQTHDQYRLRQILRRMLNRQGLADFVNTTMANLNKRVGDLWLQGSIQVFEEHLYTGVATSVLTEAIIDLDTQTSSQTALLTTAPGEIHSLGLMMANAVLALEGVHCLWLGPQIPVDEIAMAATRCSADIVALSFSAAFPGRDANAFLRRLAAAMDGSCEIWAGGTGVSRLPPMAGVRLFGDLRSVPAALTGLRSGLAAGP
ncbi:Transcriptional regulator MerR family associated with photolyase [Paramagnetospirillum magnetotacticum MS-1]|uniref:Transcriptional regulator MerR family associated with photolyase n=1 Tax=Paramagnetospirillum magnetotacticum MS-1 TaxID=272627 RepID=A0A0C2YLB8_PARME|nr:MerR family transcriptional regulator [Paramagnetospirillum magnetotacticum]KIM00570.1 Transcriptional regulator MerR family associated with photolyase [Paramagnetospirillum magnetotacticum MS-1]